jgi:MraZ protein
MEVNGTSNPAPLRAPFGMYPARLDEKGRLKLPAVFQEYLRKFPQSTYVCTSLDRRIALIYPIPVWDQYLEFLDGYSADPDAVQDVMFNAQDLGSEAEMDSQGRITLNSELRSTLDLQGQELHLMAYRGAIQVLTHAMYEARKSRSVSNGDAVKKLEEAGLGKGIRL